MTLSTEQKKALRGIGHQLHPIVMIAAQGLTAAIQQETDRALEDHELIKVKINVADRKQKATLITTLCQTLKAELVQQIGHVALIYRPAQEPNSKLSNLIRHSSDN